MRATQAVEALFFESRVGAGSAPTHRRLFVIAAFWTAACLVAFLAVQAVLALRAVELVNAALRSGILHAYPSALRLLPVRLEANLPAGAIVYVVVCLPGLALASRGHRILFVAPGILWLGWPLIGGANAAQAIGTEWRLVRCFSDGCVDHRGTWLVVGVAVDLVLVLAPAWVVSRKVPATRWPTDRSGAAVAAMVTVVLVAVVIGWTTATITQRSVDEAALVACVSIGLLVATAKPWWPWLVCLFAVATTGWLVMVADSVLPPRPGWGYGPMEGSYVLSIVAPVALAGLAASLWPAIAQTLRRQQDHALTLLIAVNVLNVIDACMTALVLSTGEGTEANPVVRYLGLPFKVLLVGVLTWVLYRKRPAAMIWPLIALACVLLYHLSGLVVNK